MNEVLLKCQKCFVLCSTQPTCPPFYRRPLALVHPQHKTHSSSPIKFSIAILIIINVVVVCQCRLITSSSHILLSFRLFCFITKYFLCFEKQPFVMTTLECPGIQLVPTEEPNHTPFFIPSSSSSSSSTIEQKKGSDCWLVLKSKSSPGGRGSFIYTFFLKYCFLR